MEPGASPLDVLILRDPKESPKKCSLVPLRGTPGIEFVAYDRERTLDGAGRVLLDPAGEPITAADAGRPLLVLDSNWRRLPKLRETVTGDPVPRRLPPLRTAYPRKSRDFEERRALNVTTLRSLTGQDNVGNLTALCLYILNHTNCTGMHHSMQIQLHSLLNETKSS